MTKKQFFRELKIAGNTLANAGAIRINSGRGDLKRALKVLKAGTKILKLRLDLIDMIAEKRTRRLLKERRARKVR